jgi:hypothetical protein
MLWQRTQFSAQSSAPLFPVGAAVVPAATSADCFSVEQPITSQERTAKAMTITAPGKPTSLEIILEILSMT